METLSAYARQFLGNMERPEVDKITGLSPVIAIEQKTTGKNPRSTVGTITEIYDFLRLLYARASIAYSYNTGEPMVKYTDDQIISLITEKYENQKIFILAPIIKGRKGHYKEVFEQIRRKGFLNARVDGELLEVKHGMKLDRYKAHFIEIVIDKMQVYPADRNRLKSSVSLAMQHGKGIIMCWIMKIKHPGFSAGS
jgi:excinuclease ABC subunit A